MRSENPNRLRAKELVSLLPGIHLRRLSRLLGLGQSSTRYHLGRLEKDGRVTCLREGGVPKGISSLNTPRRREAALRPAPARYSQEDTESSHEGNRQGGWVDQRRTLDIRQTLTVDGQRIRRQFSQPRASQESSYQRRAPGLESRKSGTKAPLLSPVQP